MKKNYLIGILVLLSHGIGVFGARAETDSLLEQRRYQYDGYLKFRTNMGQRTWINLVNLNSKAHEIIKQDDRIIDLFNQERDRINQLISENDRLQLDINLLKREAEMQEMLLKDKKYYANVYLGIIGFATLIFLVMLILFIDRQARYRSARLELERIWTTDQHKHTDIRQEEIRNFRQQIMTLAAEKQKIESDYYTLQKNMESKEKELEKTTESKNRIELEIKALIDQLKEKSSI